MNHTHQIAKREPSASSIVNWDDAKMVNFIRGQYGKDLTDQEWELFKATSAMTGANPVLEDVYAIKYKGQNAKMAIVFDHKFLIKKINETFGDFEGFTLPEYWDGDRWIPVWTKHIKSSDHETTAPLACKIGLKRKGYSEPAYSQVLWRERVKIYNGKLQAKWLSDPIGMLTKCTKVQNLRDNYGSIIGSMLIPEEIDEPADVEGMRQTPSGDWYNPDDTEQTPKERVEKTRSHQNGNLDPNTEPIERKERDEIKQLFVRLDILKKADYIARINAILDEHGYDSIEDTSELKVAGGNMVIAVLMNQLDGVDNEEGES